MVDDFWKNNDDIRKRVLQKYWQIVWIYMTDILGFSLGCFFLYQILKEKEICSFGCFLAFIVFGEFVICGFLGLMQLVSVYKQKQDYSIEKLGVINIIFYLTYLSIEIIMGIRPQKTLALILGILLGVILSVIIFFIFVALYHNVNIFNQLRRACEMLEESISKYGGMGIYYQYADVYNKMNGEIESIGFILDSKNIRKKYLDRRDVFEDLEEMLGKISTLNVWDIRISTDTYRIKKYIRGIYKFSCDVDKILEKAKEQIEYIQGQVYKKGGLLNEMKDALGNMADIEQLARISGRKVDFKESYQNLKSSHEKLAKKSRMERKIKPIKIKRGIFR